MMHTYDWLLVPEQGVGMEVEEVRDDDSHKHQDSIPAEVQSIDMGLHHYYTQLVWAG